MTTILARAARRGTAALLLSTVGACAGAGNVGEILGSVLGGGAAGGSGNQVSGVVRGVDQRAQQIGLQLSDGRTVGLVYDERTQVVYNNQRYAVASLDAGDQVTARVQSANGAYYTDLVQVDRPVQQGAGGAAGGGASNVQSLQGRVGQVDARNGMFSLDTGNGTLVVSLPYNVSRADQSRFQSLRPGDGVRLYGVFLNNSRVELRQFY
jgi:hypothetical protein